MRPVAIIGARTVRGQAFLDARLEETIFDVVAGALEDAGVAREELESVVLGASDELDGRSITSMLLAMPSGAFLKDEIRTTGGMHALALQTMRIQAGLFDLGVVVSWAKPSETSSVGAVQWTSLDPFVGRDVGLIDPIASAVMASAYLERFDRNRHDLDRRSEEKVHGRAPANGSEDASSEVSYPLRAAHLAPVVDGAAAAVVASPRAVEGRKLRRAPVWLRGLAWAVDSHALPERTLWEWPVLRQVAEDALGQAGCGVGEIDRFEVDDYSVVHEALAVEALRLAEPGTGFDYLSAEENGRRINPEGGGFGGYPPVCAGLRRLAEAYRGIVEGEERRALVHGTTGIAAQGHEVAVLEKG